MLKLLRVAGIAALLGANAAAPALAATATGNMNVREIIQGSAR
ncbi:hypothetical protein [Sinorhizobium meliloti]